jgi:hypothetical protein
LEGWAGRVDVEGDGAARVAGQEGVEEHRLVGEEEDGDEAAAHGE